MLCHATKCGLRVVRRCFPRGSTITVSPGTCGTTGTPRAITLRPHTLSSALPTQGQVTRARRILDRVTSISHSAQQHPYEYQNYIESHECCMLNEEIWKQNKDIDWEYKNWTRMLDCVGSISHFTSYRHIEHWIRMSHVLTTLHLEYAHWIVNGQCWIVEVGYWNVKTSNNSKQQCCKQEFEFWRGYNAKEFSESVLNVSVVRHLFNKTVEKEDL